MDPVGDDAVVGTTTAAVAGSGVVMAAVLLVIVVLVVAHQAREARFAVMERRHGVEDVGEGAGAAVQRGQTGAEAGGGVTERDYQAGVVGSEAADQVERTGEFRGQGHQFQRGGVVGAEVVDVFWARARGGFEEVTRVVGAFFARVQVGAFGVGAEKIGRVGEGAGTEKREDLYRGGEWGCLLADRRLDWEIWKRGRIN